MTNLCKVKSLDAQVLCLHLRTAATVQPGVEVLAISIGPGGAAKPFELAHVQQPLGSL